MPRGLTSLGLDVREGFATDKLLILCLFCPSCDNLKWGSGNVLSGTHASKPPHFLECPGCAEEVGGNCTLRYSCLFFFAPRTPLTSRLKASPAHKFPEDECSAALGAQHYHLVILPGLWDQRHLFYQQLISSDKRSCQKFKPGLLCGSAEFYTQTTIQGALYLIWFYFAVLILRSKNGLIIL